MDETFRCPKCDGYMVTELYRSDKGKTVYLKCVMCGTYVFIDKIVDAIQRRKKRVKLVKIPENPSFSQIAKMMGVTKQRVGYLYLRAMDKIEKLSPVLRRLR